MTTTPKGLGRGAPPALYRALTPKTILVAKVPDKDTTIETVRADHRNRGWTQVGPHYLIRGNAALDHGRPMELAWMNHPDAIVVWVAVGQDGRMTSAQMGALSSLISTLRKFHPGITTTVA